MSEQPNRLKRSEKFKEKSKLQLKRKLRCKKLSKQVSQMLKQRLFKLLSNRLPSIFQPPQPLSRARKKKVKSMTTRTRWICQNLMKHQTESDIAQLIQLINLRLNLAYLIKFYNIY